MRNTNQIKYQPHPYNRGNKRAQSYILSRSKQLALLVASAVAGIGGASEVNAAETLAAVSSKHSAVSSQANFDLDVLKQRGLDPKIAEYFREAARFSGGTRLVTLYVNGVKRGMVDARFDEQGQLCFDSVLIDKAGLVRPAVSFLLPDQAPGSAHADSVAPSQLPTGCYDFKAMFAQTEVELRPGKEEVSLVVPTTALRAPEDDFSGYGTGGTAALLNYDVVTLTNQFQGRASSYLSTNTEFGFNTHDWIVRSRQSYTAQDQRSDFQPLYTYGQRTLVEHKSILQVGQINVSSSVLTGAAITGFQIMPESALLNQNQNGASVDGIAQSQARVEIHQAGALIYSTVVPAGPFTLTNIPLLNSNADLMVSVIEGNGATRSFTVPAASLGKISSAAPGYSFAVGKVRRFGDIGTENGKDPIMFTASGGWLLNDRNQLSSGLIAALGYQSIGWSLDSIIKEGTSISARSVVSSATVESVRGAQFSMSAGTVMTDKLSASASITQQTNGYRDLLDVTYVNSIDFSNRAKAQYSASLRWNAPTLGGFSLSYTKSKNFNGSSFQRVVGSWGKTFKRATVSANIEHSLGSDRGRIGSDNTFYANVSIPLGERSSVRTYVNSFGGQNRLGETLSEKVNDYVNYDVTAERKADQDGADVSGNLALLPKYTQVILGYSRSGSGSTTYVGQLRGGVALHEAGVTLSPYAIQDTFGVMKVGDVSGVRIDTIAGPVWTDAWGHAVVPNLMAYRKSRLEVATKSLPRNVDIKNGFKVVEAGRGSVHYVDFHVVKVRRVLMQVTNLEGIPVAKGASVVDAQDEFITTVVDDGKLFLSNGQLRDGLKMNLPDGTQCSLNFKLPETPDLNVYFETTNAVCRPIGLVPKF